MTTPAPEVGPSGPVIVNVTNDPNVWEIVAAVGTAVAAIVALGLALLEIPARRRADAARQRAEAERDDLLRQQRRAQAAKISTYVTQGIRAVGRIGHSYLVVHVRNDSDAPVHQVTAEMNGHSGKAAGTSHVCGSVSTVPVGTHAELTPNDPIPVDQRGGPEDYHAAAEFSDANGVRWRRHSTGALTEVTGRG